MQYHNIHKTTGFKIIEGKGQNLPQWRCTCGAFWWEDDLEGQELMRDHKVDILWDERNRGRGLIDL